MQALVAITDTPFPNVHPEAAINAYNALRSIILRSDAGIPFFVEGWINVREGLWPKTFAWSDIHDPRIRALGSKIALYLTEILQRQGAVGALCEIDEPSIEPLSSVAMTTEKSRDLRVAAILALQCLPSWTSHNPQKMMHILIRDADQNIRSLAASYMLHHPEGFAGVLSAILDNLESNEWNPDEIKVFQSELDDSADAFSRALSSADEKRRDVVVRLLPLFKQQHWQITEAILAGLENTRKVSDSHGFEVYCRALDGRTANRAIPMLISALNDDPEIAGLAQRVLIDMVPNSFSAMAQVLAQTHDNRRSHIIEAVGQIKHATPEIVHELTRILATSSEPSTDREAAARTLGLCANDSRSSLRTLAAVVESGDDSLRMTAIEAIRQISKDMEERQNYQHLWDLRRVLKSLKVSADEVAQGDRLREYPLSPSFEALMQQVELSEEHLWYSWIIRWFSIPSALSIASTLVLIFLLSDRARRWWLLLIGRRWILVIGQPENDIEISSNGALLRLRWRTLAADSRETRFELPVPTAWPVPDAQVHNIRQLFATGQNVRICVDEELFAIPWANILGGKWSLGKEAVIAGQIASLTQRREGFTKSNRYLEFTGLGCAGSLAHRAPLTNVEGELKSLEKQWRRWGAAPRIVNNASREAFRDALSNSDFVHVAAHASLAGIALTDGIVRGPDLPEEFLRNLRCRLLVLSACTVGRITEESSLVFRLVRAGVSVMGSLKEIDSVVARAFMEELYRALLPSRRAKEVMLGDAIRIAVGECSRRFERVAYTHWEKDINALVLYGDPTLKLVLR